MLTIQMPGSLESYVNQQHYQCVHVVSKNYSEHKPELKIQNLPPELLANSMQKTHKNMTSCQIQSTMAGPMNSAWYCKTVILTLEITSQL